MQVQSTPDPFRAQGLLAEVADEENSLLLLEETLQDALAETAFYISLLPEERLICLLAYRYLDGCRWEEISGRMSFSISRVYRLHQQAVSLLPPPPELPEAREDV